MGKKKKYLQVIIFSVLTIGSFVLIFALTVNQDTVTALRNLSVPILSAVLGCWALYLFLDAVTLITLTKGAGSSLRFNSAVKTSFIRMLFEILTPFHLGGQPFMIFFLHKKGVGTGQATSVVMTKLLMLTVFNFIYTVIAFALGRHFIATTPVMMLLIYVSGVLAILLIVVIAVGMLRPQIFLGVFGLIEKIRLKLFPKRAPLVKFKRNVIRESLATRRSFRRYFRDSFGSFISSFLLTGVQYAAQVILLWFILKGVHSDMSLEDGLVRSTMLLFLMSFMPSPGASGFGEAIFVALFSGSIPTGVLGIVLVLWRLFNNYLSAAIAVPLSMREFSHLVFDAKELHKEPGGKDEAKSDPS